MIRKIQYIVSDIDYRNISGQMKNPCTAGTFLRSKGFSRHILAVLKNTPGLITINDHRCKIYEEVQIGDRLQILIPEEIPEFHKEPITLSAAMPPVIYEDEDLLIIDKPAGMPVHQSKGHYGDTLADAVNQYYQKQGGSIIYRCINRLDRDTTGLLIIAKNMLSGAVLSQAMKNREISRTYLANVYGKISENQIIDLPIARLEGSAIRRCINTEKGERAITHVHPLQYNMSNNMTLAEIHLETGRTHQIRVHLTSIGHPLAGDFLYTAPEQVSPDYLDTFEHSNHDIATKSKDSKEMPAPHKSAANTQYITRQALHSSRLVFRHPVGGYVMDIRSTLPEDMQAIT